VSTFRRATECSLWTAWVPGRDTSRVTQTYRVAGPSAFERGPATRLETALRECCGSMDRIVEVHVAGDHLGVIRQLTTLSSDRFRALRVTAIVAIAELEWSAGVKAGRNRCAGRVSHGAT